MLRRLIDGISRRKGTPVNPTDPAVEAMRQDAAKDRKTELDEYVKRARKESEKLNELADLSAARTIYSLAVDWQMDGDFKKALQECVEGLAMVERIPSADEERRKFRTLCEELRAAVRENG